MYMKNLEKTVYVRINKELDEFIKDTSAKMGLCPSAFVRMVLQSLMVNMNYKEIDENADI